MQRRFSRTSTDPDAAVDLESLPASAADDGADEDDDGGGAAADEAVVRRHAAWLTALLFFLYCDQNLLAPHLSAVAAEFGFDAAQRDAKLGGETQTSRLARAPPPSALSMVTTCRRRGRAARPLLFHASHTSTPLSSSPVVARRRDLSRVLPARRAGRAARRRAR